MAVGALGVELLFRAAIHGRLVSVFSIVRPGTGGWLSMPNLVSGVLYAAAATLVFGGLALLRGTVKRVRRRVRGDGRSNVRVIRGSGGYRVDE